MWRLLDSGRQTASQNMAVDETLLNSVVNGEAPALRFYQWDRPTVSIGYAQKPTEHLDLDVCRVKGIPWIRRPTGGRAVLHDQELTYAVVVPEGVHGVPRGVTASYRLFSQCLVRGLALLGVAADIAEGAASRGHTSAACFDSPSWYELVVDQRKLVGSAQTRRGRVILQHGSLLLRYNPSLYASVLRWNGSHKPQARLRLLRAKAISLEEILPCLPNYQELVAAVAQGFSETLGADFERVELSQIEREAALRLRQSKYETSGWNMSRKPEGDACV